MSPSAFLGLLHGLPQLPNVFNPWRDIDAEHDVGGHAPAIRSSNLERYLAARAGRAKLLLIAEAPGYQGCKFSGIAMTSERILLGHQAKVPHQAVFDGPKERSSKPAYHALGAIEPTASIVWSLLLTMGLAPEDFVLWNSFPCHPTKPEGALTNRAPKPGELAAAAHILPAMIALMPSARVIAVGRVAQKTLASMGLEVPHVRHPAMGGATAFREQISVLLAA